jgi:hypothetical protein
MRVSNVRRRLEALESISAPNNGSSAYRRIMSKALSHLTIEELRLLRGVALDYRRGQLKFVLQPVAPTSFEGTTEITPRGITPAELAAIKTGLAAIKKELQAADVNSRAEFEKKYCHR